MRPPQHQFGHAPVALLVGLARTGDRSAFAELVGRHQVWIRNLMRRCSGDTALADDLSQQVFLQAWRHIGRLQEPGRFAAWLKRIAINAWLQHLRNKDPLRNAADADSLEHARETSPGIAMDLDRALASLAEPVRLCIVLSYHEGMAHAEVANVTGLPLGTVKSHIRRGSRQLRERLSSYMETQVEGNSHER